MISQQENDGKLGRGAVLVEGNTILPASLQLKSGSAERTGWTGLADNLDGRQIGQKLAAAGWTFFYSAGTIRTMAFGSEGHGTIQAALKRLIATAKLQGCNCLEIDNIARRSFLGMPYVSVSAHVRHIQKGTLFHGQDQIA